MGLLSLLGSGCEYRHNGHPLWPVQRCPHDRNRGPTSDPSHQGARLSPGAAPWSRLPGRVAWVTVAVGPTDETHDALACLVAVLARAGDRKRELSDVWAALPLRGGGLWDEIHERGELQLRVRLETHDDDGAVATLRGLLIPEENVASRRPTPLCLAVRAPRDHDHATLHLVSMLELVEDLNRQSGWALEELELDYDGVALGPSTLCLLEELCRSVPSVSCLRVSIPLAWTEVDILDLLQRLDQSAHVRDLILRWGRVTQQAAIVDTGSALTNVRSVELVHATERHSVARNATIVHRQDVDLTALFRPTTAPPLALTVRCAEWSLHPVQVVTWFWASPNGQSQVTSLDLELDAMRIVTLLAALEHIGPRLRHLTLRSSLSSSSGSRELAPSLPLDAFLVDCPRLKTLEVHEPFRIPSLRDVAARYAEDATMIRSLAFRDVLFDDGLVQGLHQVVQALSDPESATTRHLRELRVEPVDGDFEKDQRLLDAIANMLHANNNLEMLVVQVEHGQVPQALWQWIQSLHLRSAPTRYAFLSVVGHPGGHAHTFGEAALARLDRDTLTTIFSFVEWPVRLKLRQRG